MVWKVFAGTQSHSCTAQLLRACMRNHFSKVSLPVTCALRPSASYETSCHASLSETWTAPTNAPSENEHYPTTGACHTRTARNVRTRGGLRQQTLPQACGIQVVASSYVSRLASRRFDAVSRPKYRCAASFLHVPFFWNTKLRRACCFFLEVLPF